MEAPYRPTRPIWTNHATLEPYIAPYEHTTTISTIQQVNCFCRPSFVFTILYHIHIIKYISDTQIWYYNNARTSHITITNYVCSPSTILHIFGSGIWSKHHKGFIKDQLPKNENNMKNKINMINIKDWKYIQSRKDWSKLQWHTWQPDLTTLGSFRYPLAREGVYA